MVFWTRQREREVMKGVLRYYLLKSKVGNIWQHTDKKENKIFLIYTEIQMGSGAKSYLRKEGLPNTVYEEMHKYFHHI